MRVILRIGFCKLRQFFNLENYVTKISKFAHLVPTLPPSIVDKAADLLKSILENKPYSCLKEVILKCTGHLDEDLLHKLFDNVTRDDQTPSQLLWYIKSFLGKNTMTELILRGLWLDWLPPTVTQILAPVSENTPFAADWIFTQLNHNVNPLYETDKSQNNTRHLEKAVYDLQEQVRELKLYRFIEDLRADLPLIITTRVGNNLRAIIRQLSQTFVGIIEFMVPKWNVHLPVYIIQLRETEHPASRSDRPCW